MKTQLNQMWQVALPLALVQEAGLQDGEWLECRVLQGSICLSPKDAALCFEQGEKKI